jgi:DNA-binding CsgD family transcriptional regulator
MNSNILLTFREILDSQDEEALIYNTKSNQILLANKKACLSLGYNIDEIINLHLDIIMSKNFEPIIFNTAKDNISEELRQFVTKCGYSFMAGTKNKIISIKNKEYRLISFQKLSNLSEVSGSDKNTDKEYIEFSKKLLAINQKITNVYEDMFYKNMVYSLAGSFKVRWAMICLLSPRGKQARIISLWDQTNFNSEITYKLEGTPCAEVKKTKGHFYCEKNLTKHFPKDFMAYQWGVESYLGIPITSKTDETLGILSIMDDKPIKKEKLISFIATMQFFSSRIAKEITLSNFKVTTLNKETSKKFIGLACKQKPLTKRELQVLDYACSGLSSHLIAKKLTVSLPTVKFHLGNIYNKLGINGRNGLLKVVSNFA